MGDSEGRLVGECVSDGGRDPPLFRIMAAVGGAELQSKAGIGREVGRLWSTWNHRQEI